MEPDQSHSRAEPPPSRRLAIALGVVCVSGLTAWGVVTMLRDRPAPLPNGMVGLRFGMTETEIKAQFPDVKREDGLLIRETTAFEQRAHCELEMDPKGRLTRIECHGAAADEPAMRAAAGKALAVARSLYGKESSGDGTTWIWKGTKSVLTVRADSPNKRLVIESRATRLP